jgi:hypothetical protein
LRRSIRYGFGCLGTGLQFRLAKMGLWRSKLFQDKQATTQLSSPASVTTF